MDWRGGDEEEMIYFFFFFLFFFRYFVNKCSFTQHIFDAGLQNAEQPKEKPQHKAMDIRPSIHPQVYPVQGHGRSEPIPEFMGERQGTA